MALINCKECGQTISTKANQCPHCGAQKKKSVGLLSGCLTVVFIFIIVGYIINLVSKNGRTGDSAPEPQVTSAPAYPTQADLALQPARKKVMENGFNRGILMKLDGTPGLSTVQVGPAYYALTLEEKTKLIETLWKYESVRTGEEYSTLNVVDGYSGKKVGSCWKRGFTPE